MATEVQESQPPSGAADIMRKQFADFTPEPEAAPQAEAPTTSPEPDAIDAATIKIPNRFTANVPKALEKFKDKTLVDFATSYEEAERQMHSKAQEAAEARRENEELKTRLAAAEQYARMSREPEKPADPWQGVDPNSAIITDPTRVLDLNRQMSAKDAQQFAVQEAQKVRDEIRAENRKSVEEAQLVTAFELARAEVGKMTGREVTVAEWQDELQDIARIVGYRTPERKFDHNAYVETYVRLKGVPKVSVPSEGNPPIASRPTSVKSESVPTLSREDQQLKKQIWGALGLKS